jgi:hypothetical protein
METDVVPFSKALCVLLAAVVSPARSRGLRIVPVVCHRKRRDAHELVLRMTRTNNSSQVDPRRRMSKPVCEHGHSATYPTAREPRLNCWNGDGLQLLRSKDSRTIAVQLFGRCCKRGWVQFYRHPVRGMWWWRERCLLRGRGNVQSSQHAQTEAVRSFFTAGILS